VAGAAARREIERLNAALEQRAVELVAATGSGWR
jgi:hypothetical protein